MDRLKLISVVSSAQIRTCNRAPSENQYSFSMPQYTRDQIRQALKAYQEDGDESAKVMDILRASRRQLIDKIEKNPKYVMDELEGKLCNAMQLQKTGSLMRDAWARYQNSRRG